MSHSAGPWLGLKDYVSTDATCLALGDKKSLSLMKSKDKEQSLFHLLQHNCFQQVGHPLLPHSGWEVSSEWDLLVFIGYCCIYCQTTHETSGAYILPFRMQFGDCGWDYNQEVTFQFTSSKGDTEWDTGDMSSEPSSAMNQATSISSIRVSSVAIWQLYNWPRPAINLQCHMILHVVNAVRMCYQYLN